MSTLIVPDIEHLLILPGIDRARSRRNRTDKSTKEIELILQLRQTFVLEFQDDEYTTLIIPIGAISSDFNGKTVLDSANLLTKARCFPLPLCNRRVSFTLSRYNLLIHFLILLVELLLTQKHQSTRTALANCCPEEQEYMSSRHSRYINL